MCLISFGPRQSWAKEDMVHNLHTYGHRDLVRFPKKYNVANYGDLPVMRCPPSCAAANLPIALRNAVVLS